MIEKQAWWINGNTTIDIEQLRPLAILIHQQTVINLQRDLWMTYVKSGTGRLTHSPTKGPSIWPVKVKSFILAKRITTNMSSADENAACMNSVYEFMQELNNKHENYQNQFTEIKNSLRLIEYSDAIEDSLRTYIEQQPSIRFLRLKCELKQTLINNDYQDQMFELNYRQHHPTEHQVNVFIDRFLLSLLFDLATIG